MNMQLPISPSQADLPRAYETAKTALAECQELDECKDWTDKAAALASYAKQAEDETLLKMATRIKARASRRAGELLNQIKSQQGARTDLGSQASLSKKQIARKAGMSERQQKQATRIANVPEKDFDVQVESSNPPTLTKLAEQGKKSRPLIDLNGRDPKEFNRALHFLGGFENYAKDLEAHNINDALRDLIPEEQQKLCGFIGRINAVHNKILERICA